MGEQFKKIINILTEEMVTAYREDEIYTSLSQAVLPDRNEIIRLINNFRELFYPKHFGNRELYDCTIEYCTGNLLLQIEQRMYRQINLVLLGKCGAGDAGERDIEAKASEISAAFMQTLPDIRRRMVLDIKAAYDGDPAAADYDQIIFSYPGVFAVMVYRIAHELTLLNVPLIPRVMTEYAHSRTGIDINPGAVIGRYFFMDHGTGIVIGETTEIGDNVQIYQGVTLGALSTRGGQDLRGKKRHPTIEDNVTIYSNASILGGKTVIGHDSVIGGSAFITASVPPNSKVSIVAPEHHVEGR